MQESPLLQMMLKSLRRRRQFGNFPPATPNSNQMENKHCAIHKSLSLPANFCGHTRILGFLRTTYETGNSVVQECDDSIKQTDTNISTLLLDYTADKNQSPQSR